MAGDEKAQRSADEKVEYLVWQDAGEVVKNDRERRDASKRIKLVESPINLAVWIS